MRFPDEVRSPDDIGLPEPTSPKKQEVAKIERDIKKLTDMKLSLKDLKDDHAERLLALVERKRRAGKDVVQSEEAPEPDEEDVPDSDLLESIRRSLQGSNGSASGNGRHKPSRKKSRVAK
jgi:DNA end-binding protein Ku